MGKPKITLNTVAARVGVSRSTVSNAYNRPDQLSPELRGRILAAASELGYAGPDPAARALRHGRAGAIGVIQGLRYAITDPANQVMLSGVAEVCEDLGLALVLIPPDRPDRPGFDVLRTAPLDGVIAHCEAFGEERRALLRNRGLPLVIIDAETADDEHFVGIDDTGGAAASARHLLELGHRRFVIFTLNEKADSTAWVSRRRLAGYHEAFRAFGLDHDSVPTIDVLSAARADAIEPACRVLSSPDRPTAVLAMSDELAVAVLHAATLVGLRVPEELSVVGFDDSPVADALGLTTVHQDHAAKGRTAATMLFESSDQPRRTVLPTTLVVRRTTGPCASG